MSDRNDKSSRIENKNGYMSDRNDKFNFTSNISSNKREKIDRDTKPDKDNGEEWLANFH